MKEILWGHCFILYVAYYHFHGGLAECNERNKVPETNG
jgi:hypothetical protein